MNERTKGSNTKIIEVEGTEYKLQKVPARWYLQHRDRCKTRNNNIQEERYAEGLLENVVVEPNTTLDDVESIQVLERLVVEIEEFLRG